MGNGAWDRPKLIPASIINFAVNGLIQIKSIEKNTFQKMLSGKDYLFENKATSEQVAGLDPGSKLIFETMFDGKEQVKLSDFKGKIFNDVKSTTKESLINKDLINKKSSVIQTYFFVIPVAIIAIIFAAIRLDISNNGLSLVGGIIISLPIIFLFSVIMSKRTPKGAELNWRIKGFKLYMKTAEKYRQQFNEKENIFEKFLPYAMIFGITKLWVKKMKQLYGEDYFQTYHPVWFIGPMGAFDIDSFTSELNSISSSMSSRPGSSSGFGGGGFSGGGGGGGGGGGW